MKSVDLGKFATFLKENKYLILLLCVGLTLLLLPRGTASETAAEGEGDPLDTESRRIGALLSAIRGVGETEVLLSAAGAVVVCEGAQDPAVRLNVTNAVAAYTGLGSDKISVMKMK